MPCPHTIVEQFSSYALCSPNLWMIIGCTFMTLLTMILTFYLHVGFRRDLKWLKFAQWKLQQLAERLRFQEPNVLLLERITRKVNEKNSDDAPFLGDFLKDKNAKDKPSPSASSADVAAKVKKAKDEDAAAVLRETNIPSTTPAQQTPTEAPPENQSILKKWTDATKDILAINDDEEKNNKVDVTQDEQQ